MNKLIKTLLVILFMNCISCKNKCGDGCPEWEKCEKGYQDMFSTTYNCKSILNKFNGDYYGNSSIIFENISTVNSKASLIQLSRNDDLGSNTMTMQINFNDSIVLLNQNLTIVFTSPSNDSFTIPSQTYYVEVYNPTIGNRVFTNVIYEGSGSISNSENNYLNINFTYTFFDQTANFQFTTS